MSIEVSFCLFGGIGKISRCPCTLPAEIHGSFSQSYRNAAEESLLWFVRHGGKTRTLVDFAGTGTKSYYLNDSFASNMHGFLPRKAECTCDLPELAVYLVVLLCEVASVE